MVQQFSRRQFLVLGTGATAVLTAAYVGLRQVGSYPVPEAEFEILTPKTAAIFAVLGDFLFPPDSPLPGHGGDTETLLRIDALLREVPPEMRKLLLALPLAFEHGTALERFGARAMTKLTANRRDAYLESWTTTENLTSTQIWLALKTVLGLTYMDRPDVARAMGLTPNCGGTG